MLSIGFKSAATLSRAAAGVAVPGALRRYHEKVIDHYEKPRNVGSFDKNAPNVGTGLVGAPACGDVMRLQIKVDDYGKIVDARFKTFGCGSAIASSSLATEWIIGKTLDEAGSIKNTDIARELSLPPVKLHCSSTQPWGRAFCSTAMLTLFPLSQCSLRMPSRRPSPTSRTARRALQSVPKRPALVARHLGS